MGIDAAVGIILPFRDKHVIQDLALAMLKAFANCASTVNTVVTSAGMHGAGVSENDNKHTQRTYVYRNRMRNVSAICERIVPMFAHWNVKQHAAALMHAIDELLS